MGLPGSGKSYLAKKIAEDCKDPLIVDDISSINKLPKNGVYSDIIITDPYFCLEKVRLQANKYIIDNYKCVEWLYFENNQEKCLKNVSFRNDGRKVEGLIRLLQNIYFPPKNNISIWQPQGIVNEI